MFKLNTFIIHLAGWLLFLLLPVLFLSSGISTSEAWVLLSSPYYWLFCLTYLTLFYFNLVFLIPRFFLKRKYLLYGSFVVVLFSCVYFLQPFDKLLAHNPRFQAQMSQVGTPGDTLVTGLPDGAPSPKTLPFGPLPHQDLRMNDTISRNTHLSPLWQHSADIDSVSLVLFFILTALSLSLRTVEQWQTTEQKVIQAEAEKARAEAEKVNAEAEKVNAELSFLKAQINPHFLFNTLNNIYTLSVMNSEHTSESIMKLSNIMRYVTDDVSNDLVPLQNDLDCIRDYIDLQRLRLGNKTRVHYDVRGMITHQRIAPLILMSFVENTFKYGVSKQENSEIYINIGVDGDQISYESRNRIFDGRTSVTERTGIGIANTRKRLEHLYSGRYSLQITDAEGIFTVHLLLYSFSK